MTTFWFALAFFGGTFTFAFGMAWMIPLSTAYHEKRARDGSFKSSPREAMEFLLDLLLLAMDSIPLFSLIRGVRELPGNLVAAREKWRAEAGVRWSFKAFCVSLSLLVVGACGAFWS